MFVTGFFKMLRTKKPPVTYRLFEDNVLNKAGHEVIIKIPLFIFHNSENILCRLGISDTCSNDRCNIQYQCMHYTQKCCGR